jgi:hypothetical protein
MAAKPLLFPQRVAGQTKKKHGALHSHRMKWTGIAINVIPGFRHQIALVLGIHICNDIKVIKLWCGGGTANCP